MVRKILLLRKIETFHKTSKYCYEVLEEGKVIATRNSNKDYVACFVVRNGKGFRASNFFSNSANMLKGQYGSMIHKVYAIGTLNGQNIEL